jgi:para-nitrobenzyl esterase
MIVETATGKVQGVVVGVDGGAVDDVPGEVLQFRGIPYAKAERFRPPEPAAPWAGVRDASRFGPIAPQTVSVMDQMLGLRDHALGEDCLTLDVCTPGVDDARRPVMVWIHGGGFVQGCSQLPHYDGAHLAALGDVVVVNVNYRLGALGFLHLDHLVPDLAGSGANGLRDQIAALEWVRDNVAAFGGDPGRVTLFGESAGAMSVAILMAADAATGLFHAAITQSGTADNLLDPEAAEFVTAEVLRHLDLAPSPAAVDVLRELPVDRLLEVQRRVVDGDVTPPGGGERLTAWTTGRPRYLQLPFQPVADGGLVPHSPVDAVRAGHAAGIPLIAGTNADEWRLFMMQDGYDDIDDERLRRRAARIVGPDAAAEVVDLYREARPGDNGSLRWCALVTDHVFRMPAIRLAEAQLPHAPVHMYRFDHPSRAFGGLPGACHSIEIPFVFDNLHVPGVDVLLGGIDDGTRALGRRCATAWAAMARTGAPAHADLPWPAYDLTRRATCILHRSPEVQDDPEGELRRFWQSLPALRR